MSQPEPPDFEEIALRLWNDGDGSSMAYILEQLRQAWNARGAADIAKLEEEFHGRVDEVWVRDVYVLNLERALRSLDE